MSSLSSSPYTGGNKSSPLSVGGTRRRRRYGKACGLGKKSKGYGKKTRRHRRRGSRKLFGMFN
jgi:hypothetical protein